MIYLFVLRAPCMYASGECNLQIFFEQKVVDSLIGRALIHAVEWMSITVICHCQIGTHLSIVHRSNQTPISPITNIYGNSQTHNLDQNKWELLSFSSSLCYISYLIGYEKELDRLQVPFWRHEKKLVGNMIILEIGSGMMLSSQVKDRLKIIATIEYRSRWNLNFSSRLHWMETKINYCFEQKCFSNSAANAPNSMPTKF